jgi:hypothetical protein
MADNETASYAVRWAKRLPGRWARNGAIFAALTVFAYSDSHSVTYILHRPAMLTVIAGYTTGVVGITFLLGLWARWSLSPIDEPNLAAGVRTILRKWIVGALVLGVLTILSDVILQWRGQPFAVGGTPEAIAENIGRVVGMALAWMAIGLITGYVSRWGLKGAIADNALRLMQKIPEQTANHEQRRDDSFKPSSKNFIIRHWRGSWLCRSPIGSPAF